jgi:hypothetical protein
MLGSVDTMVCVRCCHILCECYTRMGEWEVGEKNVPLKFDEMPNVGADIGDRDGPWVFPAYGEVFEGD